MSQFDIGIYTMITSMDPLRIYVFEGDVLLRFCPEKYHPFDAATVSERQHCHNEDKKLCQLEERTQPKQVITIIPSRFAARFTRR